MMLVKITASFQDLRPEFSSFSSYILTSYLIIKFTKRHGGLFIFSIVDLI